MVHYSSDHTQIFQDMFQMQSASLDPHLATVIHSCRGDVRFPWQRRMPDVHVTVSAKDVVLPVERTTQIQLQWKGKLGILKLVLHLFH